MPAREHDSTQQSSTRLHLLRAPCYFRFRFQSINAQGTLRHVQPQQLAAFTFRFRLENLEHQCLNISVSTGTSFCPLVWRQAFGFTWKPRVPVTVSNRCLGCVLPAPDSSWMSPQGPLHSAICLPVSSVLCLSVPSQASLRPFRRCTSSQAPLFLPLRPRFSSGLLLLMCSC